MNTTKVTFSSDIRTITIDFIHNVETESLDYTIDVNPPIDENEPLDLSAILADKFLGSLIQQDTVEIVPEESISEINEL